MDEELGRLMQKARAGAVADRRAAVGELASIEAPDALSILQALGASDPDRDVRVLACRAARDLRTRLSSGTMEVASQTGIGAPALADRLRSPEPSERAKAIYGCLRYESEKVLGAILDLLEREASPKVRAIAVAAVGVLGSASETEPMRRFLADPDLSVRAAADEAVMKLSELAPALPLARPLVSSVARTPAAPPPSVAKPPAASPAVAARPAAAPAGPPSALKPPSTLPTSGPGLPSSASRPSAAVSPFSTASKLTIPGRPGGSAMGPTGQFRMPGSPGLPGAAGKSAMGKPAAGPPLSEKMTDDERTRLTRLLSSLSGGILAELEKSRLVDRGSKFYQEVALRLAMPALPPDAARALFFLAANNKTQAAEVFRAASRDILMAPHLDPFLKLALPEAELTTLRTAPEILEEALTGRDCFPPEVLEVVLGALRRGKGLMNELDVPQRTKLRIKLDALKEMLATGNVEEGGQQALLLRRELTRLANAKVATGPKYPKK